MGKNIETARNAIDKNKKYSLEEAVLLIKKNKFAKFDETLDISMPLGVDPKHSDQMVRGVVNLPAGTGKNVRVAVICKDDKIEIAKSAGADIAGGQSIIDDIKNGNINFDVCIATPDMMGFVGQVARILGPKGLMPNPKLGTVTVDIDNAVRNVKSGQVEYRVDKCGIIHAGIGKLSFSDEDLLKNANEFIYSITKAKPSGVKGDYIKKIYLSSTMGISLRINDSLYKQK